MKKYWTIEGFEQLTKQQLFDMSAKHILTTRKRSVDMCKQYLCRYDGSGCAASPFLKEVNRHKADNLARSRWSELARQDIVPKHHVSFVRELQLAHDAYHPSVAVKEGKRSINEEFVTFFKERMRDVATMHALDASILDEKEQVCV